MKVDYKVPNEMWVARREYDFKRGDENPLAYLCQNDKAGLSGRQNTGRRWATGSWGNQNQPNVGEQVFNNVPMRGLSNRQKWVIYSA